MAFLPDLQLEVGEELIREEDCSFLSVTEKKRGCMQGLQMDHYFLPLIPVGYDINRSNFLPYLTDLTNTADIIVS